MDEIGEAFSFRELLGQIWNDLLTGDPLQLLFAGLVLSVIIMAITGNWPWRKR